MFQNYEVTSDKTHGAGRLALLRAEMAGQGLAGFIVPRADAYQGEYVAACDARLAWLTGFTGSAGFCAVSAKEAAVFADGRYKVQVRAQIDQDAFTPVDWPATQLGDWLAARLAKGDKLGFDPWLHTMAEVEALQSALSDKGVELCPVDNLVDAVWADRPAAPSGLVIDHPLEFAGETSADKRARLGKSLADAGHGSAVLTLPDSISWLLNIRGSDIPRVPIVQAFAILKADGRVALFADPAKFANVDLGPEIALAASETFAEALAGLSGPVRVDKGSAPYAVSLALTASGVEIAYGDDPCQLPKACKNSVEQEGARAAHLRDAVAMVKFLTWVDKRAPTGTLTEIEAAQQLEKIRSENNQLLDISFETISGAGPNAALPHYRVNTESNRTLTPGEVLLVDSGGQYRDGTTDITRTMATGEMDDEIKEANTRVLQGMIAISRARFPRGVAGRDLDPLARYPLWLVGQDFDHGTGHGVGSYLSVHEGPQRLSRVSTVPFEPGMILSNEPGYYREGHFGIRIENLVIVQQADELGDKRDQLSFETITFVPIDRRLILPEMLSKGERDWLNDYHAEVLDKVGPALSGDELAWLQAATAPV